MAADRIVYVNGAFVPEAKAKISVFDRGFLFADGVYEVCSILKGALVDNEAHLRRLGRSLDEMRLTAPVALEDIPGIQKELVARNNLDEGIVYLQVSRGAADRDFAFPANASPSLVMFTQQKRLLDDPAASKGITVATVDDIRWKRRDIKTVGLIGAVLAKEEAIAKGANDAWMVEDGFVTEGSSNNAFIVSESGAIITRHLGNEILHGITRRAVLSIVEELGLVFEERPFTVEEASKAREAFITSASAFVMPVVSINGAPIGNGAPGPITMDLRKRYIDIALESCERAV